MSVLEKVKIEDINKGVLIIDDRITAIKDGAFSEIDCDSVKAIKLSKNLKNLQFSDIYKLKNVEKIIIDNKCVTKFANLKLLPALKVLEVTKDDRSYDLRFTRKTKIHASSEKGVTIERVRDSGVEYIFFGDDGLKRYTLDSLQKFFEKQGATKNHGTFSADKCINIHLWSSYNKFLPNNAVIFNMPVKSIPNYYINNNCLRWGELVKRYCKTPEHIENMFKCCLSLGLFSEKGSVRDKAFDFISNLASTFPIDEWIFRFEGFRTETKGFQPEFAKFFMENCLDPKRFLKDDVSYLAKVYNHFKKIKTAYPHKIVKTNRRVDKLTEQNAIGVVKELYAEKLSNSLNVQGNSLSALAIRYGYTEQQVGYFEDLFKQASKSLDEFSFTPKKEEGEYGFELLDKLDPLAIALGDITNCCQRLGDKGQICMEYGVTRPNSCFLVFRKADTIIGQSWVWYDKDTGIVCLDNIEMPEGVSKLFRKNTDFAKGIMQSVNNACEYVFKDLSVRGFKVNRVTMGMGNNDLKEFTLDKLIDEDLCVLTDYSEFAGKREAYSDATNEQRIMYTKADAEKDLSN